MPGDEASRAHGRPVWLVPLAVFAVLAALTFVVASRQVALHRALLVRHTEDVCVQASRRIQTFVDSRLRVAQVFAERWSSHETRDFSRARFEGFGSVLVRLLPGYAGLALVPPGGGAPWAVPPGVELAPSWQGEEYERALEAARAGGGPVLSAPAGEPGAEAVFFAALPLRRGHEDFGDLVVQFGAESLIGDYFAERIREEFAFQVRDGGEALYTFAPEGQDFEVGSSSLLVSERFPVRNRTWTLSVVPRPVRADASGWSSALPVVVLGLLLSLGLAGLVQVTLHRLELHRLARDRALRAVAAREEAQEALVDSEARYRSVFDSATDGLVIMDPSGIVVEANPAACRIHGYRPGELAGRSYPELISPESRHLWGELVEQLDSHGTVHLSSEHVTKEGGRVDLEVRGTAFTYGEAPRVLVILTDVTELKRSAQRHEALSRKVLVAQEEERARISRELHDELGQVLTAARMDLGRIGKALSADDPATASDLANATSLVENAAQELRHICKGLRPPLLDDLGLEPALRLLVEEFEERSGISVELRVSLGEAYDVPTEVALTAYRIVQESLTNVSRHAAASQVEVSLVRRGDELLASVYDDGRGFELDELGATASSGIAGMRERAVLVGGAVEIRSARFQGTRVTLRTPLGGALRREEAP